MDSPEKLKECLKDIESEELKKLATIMIHLSKGDADYGIRRANISMLVEKCFDGFPEAETQQVRNILTRSMVSCTPNILKG